MENLRVDVSKCMESAGISVRMDIQSASEGVRLGAAEKVGVEVRGRNSERKGLYTREPEG